MGNVFKRLYNDIKGSKYIIANFVNQELTVKYKRSVLGFFWSLLSPLATMIIGSFVFGSIMRFDLKDFVVFLYAAMLPWNFFTISVDFCGVSILNNEGFIKKIYIPKIIFPLSTVCAQFINMIFSMVAMFIIMLFLGAKITPALLFLPVSFIILILFTFGASLITATATVYFRDTRYLVSVAMTAWFYITPILYPISSMPENLQPIFMLNPTYYIIDMFRQPIYYNSLPSWESLLIAAGLGIAVFVVGLCYFYSKERDFVYRL